MSAAHKSPAEAGGNPAAVSEPAPSSASNTSKSSATERARGDARARALYCFAMARRQVLRAHEERDSFAREWDLMLAAANLTCAIMWRNIDAAERLLAKDVVRSMGVA